MISVDQFGVYGTVSDWCEELAQQISDPCSTITGKPVAELNDESETRVAPTVASIQPLINAAVQGNLVRQRNERFENLPEDVRVSKAGEDAEFLRKVSRERYFVTIHDIELTGFGYAGSCREKCPLEMMEDRNRKDGYEGIQKMAQYWKSQLRVTCITMELKSKLIGSQFWIVISRVMNNCVNELPEENG